MKRFKSLNKKIQIIIGIALLLLIIVVGLFVYYKQGISAVSSDDTEVIVTVEKGDNANLVLNKLDAAGLVKDKNCAKIFLKFHSYDDIKQNTYILKKSMSISTIYDVLEEGKFENLLKMEFKIIEGTTIPEIAELIAKTLNISNKEVLKQMSDQTYLKSLIKDYWFIDNSILNKDLLYPLEGYLYPETYYVTDENPTVHSLVKLAIDMMDQQLSPYKEDIKTLNWTPHQFLSFVSVVEREALFDDDKPIIAGVFMNRLNEGWLLQSDITVNYALQRTGVNVSIKQTQTDSPYNTYKYAGLPVGPISSVSKGTMEACVHYTKHDYMFFFATKEGKVLYSVTLAEHEKQVKDNRWY